MSQTWTPKPFAISVPDQELEDLHRRLQATRLPDEIPDSSWRYGTSLSYVKDLVDHWTHKFDWRAQEKMLNAFPQYRIEADDLTLHYLHVPGVGPNPMPLLLIHGWPGSIVEFYKVIGPLTDPSAYGGDPKDAFTVVAPSLPGYGFSHTQGHRRYSIEETADLFVKLMTEVLGYSKFATQGGDWGSFVAGRLGQAHNDLLIGVHLNMIPVAPHPSERGNLTEAEAAFLKEAEAFVNEESGYQAIQGTKPQTLAYALTDSPVGLAAWIAEKFFSWTDCHGDIETRISKDELLTNVMIYWATRTINSSFWLYYMLRHKPWRLGRGEKIAAPTAVAAFPREILRPPREWATRVCNLQQWTAMAGGGHFAALEEPKALVEDVRRFFRTLR